LAQIDLLASEFPLFWMISVLLTFIMIWLPAYAIVTVFHKRPFLTLFTAAPKIRWRRIWHGIALYGGLILLASLIEGTIIHPTAYQFVYDSNQFWWYALSILLLVPIQATAEEILFRGYILQATSLATRNFIILSLLNGVLFMLPHLFNAEIQISPVLIALSYVLSGFFFTYITLKDNGAELAIGAHVVNNLFALMITNLADSSIQTSPLFLVTELDPVYALISQAIASLVFVWVMFWLPQRPSTKRESPHQA